MDSFHLNFTGGIYPRNTGLIVKDSIYKCIFYMQTMLILILTELFDYFSKQIVQINLIHLTKQTLQMILKIVRFLFHLTLRKNLSIITKDHQEHHCANHKLTGLFTWIHFQFINKTQIKQNKLQMMENQMQDMCKIQIIDRFNQLEVYVIKIQQDKSKIDINLKIYQLLVSIFDWILLENKNLFGFLLFIQHIINQVEYQMRAKPVPPVTSSKLQSSGVKNSQSKVKKQTPTAWRDRISPQDYQHLRDVFLIFDEDGSGTIDPQQIVKVLQEIGLDKRNPHIVKIIWALRQTNKILTFEQFVDIVGTQIGQYRTRDGLERIFKIYDKEENGVIRFQQLKQIAKSIGEMMNDDAILELMHSVFINQKTQSNEQFTFDEFYQVITAYYSRNS